MLENNQIREIVKKSKEACSDSLRLAGTRPGANKTRDFHLKLNAIQDELQSYCSTHNVVWDWQEWEDLSREIARLYGMRYIGTVQGSKAFHS